MDEVYKTAEAIKRLKRSLQKHWEKEAQRSESVSEDVETNSIQNNNDRVCVQSLIVDGTIGIGISVILLGLLNVVFHRQ